MTDPTTPTPAGSPGGPDDDGGGGGALANPATWLGLVVLVLAAALVVFLLVRDDDDDEVDAGDATTTTTVPEDTTTTEPGDTTTTAPEDTTTTEPEDTTTTGPEETTTTTEGGPEPVEIVESPVRAELEAYVDPDDDRLPFGDGEVTAHWYRADDRYVAVFAGWDAEATDPQCPGTSLGVDGGFDHVTNSPTEPGACDPEDEYPEIAGDDAGARVCGGLVLYVSAIPVTGDDGEPTTGDVHATVERVAEGELVGLTGSTELEPDDVPEIDPEAPAYRVPDGFLADGDEVVCDG